VYDLLQLLLLCVLREAEMLVYISSSSFIERLSLYKLAINLMMQLEPCKAVLPDIVFWVQHITTGDCEPWLLKTASGNHQYLLLLLVLLPLLASGVFTPPCVRPTTEAMSACC
jgi:hypothetical protein